MKIEQITVTGMNIMDVIQDQNTYAIREGYFRKEEYRMEAISKIEVGDLISGKVVVIRITK